MKDFRFRRGLKQDLWSSFKELETKQNLSSFNKYYKTLVTWINDNRRHFDNDIYQLFRLDILVGLDPSKYVVDNPDITLDMECRRMFDVKPKYLEELALRIGTTLWDLTTIYSGQNCPNCIYDDELRFVMLEITSQTQYIALNCESCGRVQTLEGEEITNNQSRIIPASKEDIRRFTNVLCD